MAQTKNKLIFSLDTDLQYFYGDVKYSREQVLKIIVNKCLIYNDIESVKGLFDYLICNESHRFIGDGNKLLDFENFLFDLKNLVLKIPGTDYQKQLLRLIVAYHNSAFYWHRARYFLLTEEPEIIIDDEVNLTKEEIIEADEIVFQYLSIIISGGEKLEDSENKNGSNPNSFLNLTEVGKILGCTRQTVYNVHIKQGLKTVHPNQKSDRGQRVKYSDLMLYMVSRL